MSDNPFAAPTPNTGAKPVIKKAPGGLTAVLIISLVLGILGLLGSCAGAGGLAFQSKIQEMQAEMDPGQAAMQEELAKVQNKQLIPNLIMLGLNFIVAPLLIFGAIGGLNRKQWGHKILGIGLLLAAFLAVLKTVLTAIMQLQMIEPMQKGMAQGMPGNADPAAAEMAASFAGIAIYVAIGFSVFWAIALLVFYLWGWTYLRKEPVRQYFGVE